MEWSKAKNLIILLLAAVNVFLLCNFLRLVYKNVSAAHNTAAELVSYLDAMGISMETDVLPRGNPGRTVMIVERNAEQEAAAARSLLGDASLTANEDGVYVSSSGELRVKFGGYLEAVFAQPTGESDIWELFERSGIALWQPSADGRTAQLAYSELPVFNCRLNAEDRDDSLQVTGRICVGKVFRTDSDRERDAAGLIVGVAQRMILSGATEIRGAEPGWIAGSVSNVGLRLTPVLRLTSDAGDYYVNAVDGTLMSVE